MEHKPTAAIVFLPRDGARCLMLEPILFDPAARWLAETLKGEGVDRFLVVCDAADQEAAAACFPEGALFVTTGATDAAEKLAGFLSQAPGEVAVITRPLLLAPADSVLELPAEKGKKGIFSLSAAALSAALSGGKGFDDALEALGDAKCWRGRWLPLKAEPFYQAAQVDPLARRLGAERLLRQGVSIVDVENVYIGPAVTVGPGSTILPGSILRGRTSAGRDCQIGPNAMMTDSRVGDGVTVNCSQMTETTVGDRTVIGPFAYMRPNTHVGSDVKVGDFVELKNSYIGDGTKISHLTYVGDSDVGAQVNFGCGTVTVNYDGAQKFRTTIGDHAFIGCNANLVAPVTVGEGAYIAAGSTITQEVPPDSLAIARSQQTVKNQWAKKRRGRQGDK